MSAANLLTLVQEYQDKNTKTIVYYSLSTCVKLLTKKRIDDMFIVTFGEKAKPPKHLIHKHISISPSKFISFQPFRLDTLLISVADGTVIDRFAGKKDIEDRTIRTVKHPNSVLNSRPFLAIRAAALVAETGFALDTKLESAMTKTKKKLKSIDGKIIWREFKRILRADTPSAGINVLYNTGLLDIIMPELSNCYGVEQNIKYHKYTVFEHCLLACDSCVKGDIRLQLAALIHDTGKPTTKGENDNGITFHKHEVESTKAAKKIVARFKLKKKDSAFVVMLVQNHMYQYDRAWKDSTVRKFIKRVGLNKSYIGKLEHFPLFKLRNADRMGRGLQPITQKQLDFEERLEKELKLMD